MCQVEARPGQRPYNDQAVGWVFQLMTADDKGDFEQAALAQRQLKALGWYVSRKPPEQPKSKRQGRRPGEERTVTQ